MSGSDGWVRMWDLTKILSARIPVSEAAAERPIFRLDPMNEDRILWSVLIFTDLGRMFLERFESLFINYTCLLALVGDRDTENPFSWKSRAERC